MCSAVRLTAAACAALGWFASTSAWAQPVQPPEKTGKKSKKAIEKPDEPAPPKPDPDAPVDPEAEKLKRTKTARRILDDLFRPPPRELISPLEKLGSAKKDEKAATSGGRILRDEDAEAKRAVAPDGFLLVQRPVVVRRIDGLVTIGLVGKDFPVLPCELLHELEEALEVHPRSYFIVTAQFTSFQGRNYAILRRVERLTSLELSEVISVDVAAMVLEAENRLGIDTCDRPAGRVRDAGRSVPRIDDPRTPTPVEKPTPAKDVLGHLAIAVPEVDTFFDNDPTRARRRLPTDGLDVPHGIKLKARVLTPAELFGRAIPHSLGQFDLREEGSLMLGRSGRLVRRGGTYSFHPDDGSPGLAVLPSTELEKAESLTENGTVKTKLRISGELLRYDNRNFLLLQRAVAEPYDINDARK